MNANNTINNTAQLQADYKRIIENNLNINRPRTPALIRYRDIARAIETQELIDFDLAPIENWKPNADHYAKAHKNRSQNVAYHVKQFINEQERITDKRRAYRKTQYSWHDWHNGTALHYKKQGQQLSRAISDANKPPAEIEQDRKMIDYTLRACEYLKRISNLAYKGEKNKIRDRLEPNLKHVDNQFESGEWVKVHWYELGMDTPVVDRLNYLFHLHRVHVSLKSPLQIAHYPSLRHLRDRREVITKLGKYLTTFKDFIGLNESEIKNYVEKYSSMVAGRTGWIVNFIESNDADGFERVYLKSKAKSCMTDNDENTRNAIRTYAHDKSVIRLAYLVNVENEVIARTIVREDKKQYIRCYPDANGSTEGRYLQDYLKSIGYTHGDLAGCLLDAVEHDDYDDIYRAPYIDGGVNGNGGNESAQSGSIVEIDGKDYIEINYDGYLNLARTDGFTDSVENDEDYSTCECCGDRTHNDDVHYTWHDEYVCDYCADNRYVYAFVERNREELVYEDNVIEVNHQNYWDECDFEDFNIYYCLASDEWHHIDDLRSTSMGNIHHTYAVMIDHEDKDGNNYAHHEHVHELSDGTTCHKDDADELQAEIDHEKAEYPDALKESFAPVFEVLNNAIDANQLQGQQNEK